MDPAERTRVRMLTGFDRAPPSPHQAWTAKTIERRGSGARRWTRDYLLSAFAGAFAAPVALPPAVPPTAAGAFFDARRLISPSMPCCFTTASNSERYVMTRL